MTNPTLAPLTLGLAGYGTVGTGLARILHENKANVMARTGREIHIRTVLVRDTAKKRNYSLPEGATLTDDPDVLLNDPAINVVVELMGGIETPYALIERALKAGKHVVTANKALLAEAGAPLFALAAEKNLHLAFEASVCGGIPVVQTLREGLVANHILALVGILNGTSNYILSEMSSKGLPYESVLRKAQELGYAEADPTLDVEGIDAAHKLALLIRLAWGHVVPFEEMPVQGVSQIQPKDIAFAREFGYHIKLVGSAKVENGKLEAGVYPALVHQDFLLARVNGAFNAIRIHGDAVGPLFLHGKGAGDLPTGSAVAADIFAIARNANPNNTGFSSSAGEAQLPMLPQSETTSPYYIRLQLPDSPGVLRDVAAIMAENDISVAQAIQRGDACDYDQSEAPACVPFIIMTHEASTKSIEQALRSLEERGLSKVKPVFYRVLEKER
ncbi:homoserine dehydrogenase [Desulfovibrio cuneatus]|uniref:homoserine dehydrogenase n=1 Tax=Desulfovibrio cuneatus TaxID=159728 RepID=UPI0003F95D26|nr:homoserine dehydrogenase [Desulfovibrio cuneatus]